MRGGQAAARLLRAAGSAGLGAPWRRWSSTRSQRGLLVIADGKRGGRSGSAPGPTRQSLFERLGADLATVNPLLGGDAIEPFVTGARAAGAGVLLLVRTSNPGAADVQDLELAASRGSADRGHGHTVRRTGSRTAGAPGTVWERLAELVGSWARSAWGSPRASATWARWWGPPSPEHLARARELMPHAVLLLPGVGAQGGRVEDLAAAFAPGRAGGLITASRSIAGAHLATGGDPAEAARAEAERLRAAAWSLGG